MAERVDRNAGGILGLCRLLSEQSEAIEFDLIALGLRLEWLGSPALSWRDLWVIVRQAPRTAALTRALHGDLAEWTRTTWMIADLFDAVQGGNWQRGGGKGSKPKPYPRPNRKHADVQKFGSGALPIDELDAWLKAREV